MDLAYFKTKLEEKYDLLKSEDLKQCISVNDRLKIIHQADLLMANTFCFNKKWDMERCPCPFKVKKIDFNMVQNADQEWCFMLNRMDWLSFLVLAGKITKQKAYYQKAHDLIILWLMQHPKIKPELSTRTLDTGIRLVNLLDATVYLNHFDFFTDSELDKLGQSLYAQCKYLKRQYIPKYKTSNWGPIQLAGFLITYPYLCVNYQKNKLYAWARKEYLLELNLQILDDGMDWEQSPMYHVEIMLYIQRLLFEKQNYDPELIITLKNKLKSMTLALAGIITPSGDLEAFGDTDRINTKDIFSRSALILNNSQFKFLGLPKLDYETLYYLGCGQNRIYAQIKASSPKVREYKGKDCGNFAFRSSWQSNANYLFFNNGPMGSGHGHADNLHFSLYIKGQPFLVDSGRYTYREDSAWRVRLKSMYSHNTLVVDRKPICVPNGSWTYAKYGTALKSYICSLDKVHYLEGSLVGCNPLCLLTRKVFFIEEGIVIIIDHIRQNGEHKVEQYFHLDPTVQCENGSFKIKQEQYQIINSGQRQLKDSKISFAYNSLSENKTLVFSHDFLDEIVIPTIICPTAVKIAQVPIKQDGSRKINQKFGQAWQISLSPKDAYIVVNFNHEMFKSKKDFEVSDVFFHAQNLVIHEINHSFHIFKLKT